MDAPLDGEGREELRCHVWKVLSATDRPPGNFRTALRKKTLLFLFPGPFHEEIFLRCYFLYYFYLINPDY